MLIHVHASGRIASEPSQPNIVRLYSLSSR